MALGAGGCLFEPSPLEARQCQIDADCPEGDVCGDGYCQSRGGVDTPQCSTDLDCDDGAFCNGAETCDPDDAAADVDGCVQGEALDISDGIACTEDACDESADEILHIPGADCECVTEDDPRCPAMFDGVCETGFCDTTFFVCASRAIPLDTPCDSEGSCVVGAACDGQGACVGGEPSNAACDDGAFCNGAEICDPDAQGADGAGCVAGEAPVVSDESPCTDDFCDENNDLVVHVPNDACGCEIDTDCLPAEPNACLRYFCRQDTNTCATETQQVGTLCDDGFLCTDADSCNAQGECQGVPIGSRCDDGAFCNGPEFCDPDAQGRDANGCVRGVDPLTDFPPQPECVALSCNEDNDTIDLDTTQCGCPGGDASECPEAPQCRTFVCTPEFLCELENSRRNTDCDDGVACTNDDTCDGQGVCVPGEPSNTVCDNDAFCDGEEICEPGHPNADLQTGCRSQNVPVVDDGLDCTEDACDEDADEVTHVPSDAFCDNGVFCDGVEVCDLGLGCTGGEQPEIDDGIACTIDSCDDDADVIVHTPGNAECTDGAFCNGAEICDPTDNGADAAGCIPGDRIDPDDGVACTTDVCDEDADEIVNTPNPAACDNDLFCDGAEICAPDDNNAGVDGCLDGTPPEIDDGNPCTDDACNEDNDTIENIDNEDCECEIDDDCPPVEGACAVAACVDNACVEVPLDEGEACNDGFSCTQNDACDGAGACVGNPRNGRCDDGAFCNGDETCDPNNNNADGDGCVPGSSPIIDDGVACTVDACDEDADEVTHVPDDAFCDDQDICNGAEVCDPVNDCQSQALLDDGTSCGDIDCGNGAQAAECQDGQCVLDPEGPTGTATCGDAIDNDCDGNIDGADTDCVTPNTVTIAGPDTADAGFAEAGATLEITSSGATNQARNLYCVSRQLAHEDGFDQTPQDDIAFTGPDDAALENQPAEVTFRVPFDGDNNTLGARFCDGYGAIWGPFEMPAPNVDPLYSYVLTARLGAQAGELGAGEYLIMSYRTNGTNGKWLPLVMIGNGFDAALQEYRYHLYNSNNVRAIEIRFEVVATDGNEAGACGFVEDVRLSLAPVLPLDDDGTRLRPDWTFKYGTVTEPAFNSFQTVNANEFFNKDDLTLRPGNYNFSTNNAASISGNTKGMRWRYKDGTLGMAPLPPVLTPISYDRTNPLVLHMHARMNDTDFDKNEVTHISFGVNLDVNNLAAIQTARKLASLFSSDLGNNTYYDTHYNLGETTTALENRFHLILPEEAKPLVGRTIGFAMEPIDNDAKRTYIDEIDYYVHTEPGSIDRNVTGFGPEVHDSDTHLIGLKHASVGEAIVQCYWQIPDAADTATVASEPIRVIFE